MLFRDGGVPPGAVRWDPTPAPRSAAASGRAPETNRLRAVVPAVKRLLQQPPTKATYAIRLPENESLRREVAELLVRPVGRPSRKPLVRYKSFHARYCWLPLAEGHLNRRLFASMLRRIWALPLPSG